MSLLMDRFSLLLLEPGEIYFEDCAVTLHRNPDFKAWPIISPSTATGTKNAAHQRNNESDEPLGTDRVDLDMTLPMKGRLKICSKSLVFVPSREFHKEPLLKFPLRECSHIQEWFPKSFQSILAREQNLIAFNCTSCVIMLTKNRLAPFKYSRHPVSFVFALQYGKVDDYLSQICQLQRASTLPPVEQNGMIAAIVYSRQSRLQFDLCWLESIREKFLLKTVGNKITPLVINPGRIVLTDTILYFQPYNNAEINPITKVRLSAIKRIFQRRYLLRPLGLEIDYTNPRGKPDHIYLTFNQPEDRQRLYHKLISQDVLVLEDSKEDTMTLKWQNGLISNFDYLLYLNSSADRSFNDLTQYPVFPWVISDYTSKTLDLDDPKSFRDLTKPMGALNPERLASLKDRVQDMPDPKFLYGSHYSTPGFVLYFLVRKIPECMLCLQNGKFDQPDRMFNSIPQTWINVTTHHSDFKELVPEFYMPENEGDFLENRNHIDFGVRHCGTPVGDVELPPWAKSPAHFVQTLRTALDSDLVSKNLHNWIDLIFGYKQRGPEAGKADNVFYHLCYEGCVDMDTIVNLEDRYALEVQIGEFGQVPKQLFTSPHPSKNLPHVDDEPDSPTEGKPRPSDSNESLKSLVNQHGRPNLDSIKLWKDTDLFTRVCDYKVHKETLSCVAISIDNLWIFSISHDSILKMYSIPEMQVLRSISVPGLTLSSCYPLPNNKTVLLGSKDHSLCSYSIEYGRTSDFLDVHRDAVSCLDWRGGILATGSWDCTVKIWACNEVNGYKVRLGEDFKAELDHASHVTCLHIGPDRSQLVSGTREGLVVLWCLNSYQMIQELQRHKRQVKSVRFSHDGTRVASCGSDFKMKVIDLKTGSILFSKDLGEELNCLAWDGRIAILGGGSGHLLGWNMLSGEPLFKIQAHKGPVTAIAVSEDGNFIVTGGDDRKVIVWTGNAKKTI